MTERWRKKLEGIDQVGPSDDVYERAKAGPTLPEAQSPMQRTSTRVATAIAAFVVFALAISLFAIPTLRLHDDSNALSAGGRLLPLWPARTTDEVQALQAQADSGDAAWALDPRQVATRFGQAVLGWPDAWAGGVSSFDPTCGVVPGTYPNTASPEISCAYAAGSNSVVGIQGEGSGTGMASCDPAFLLCGQASTGSDASTGPQSGSLSFAIAVCDPSSCHAAPTETVELFQPIETGDGRIWAVIEATSPSIDLAVSAGQTVREGSSISTGARIRTGEQFGFGVHVGASGSCSLDKATDVYHGPIATDGLSTSAGSEIATNFGPVSGTSCQQSEPGYVFAATGGKPIVRDGVAFDPLQPGGAGLYALSAVPITFEWPAEAASSAPIPTTSTGWTTYTDPLGWTIDVPNGWTSGPIALEVGLTITTGAWLTSGAVASLPTCQVSTPTPGATATSCREGPVASPGQVVLTVAHSTKNPDIRDDSPIPLDPDPFIQNQGEHGGAFFFADGIEFGISMYTGDDKPLSPAQEDVVRKMISSIRFQPWSPGEIRGDFAALNPTANRPASWKQDGLDWQRIGGRTFVYMENGRNGVLLGPMPDCGPGEVQDAAANVRAALLECPDGTKGGWTIDGQPLMDNSPGLTDPVPPSHVVRAWDGTLISPVVQLP